MKLLVIEDDKFIAQALLNVLSSHNYAVEVATDGQAGWDLLEAFDYDLVVLDVLLPKLDGVSLCRQIRSKGLQMPILLLTGRDSSHDKAIGLDAGADDYLVKPFDPEELVARVRALLRRGGGLAQPLLTWGDLQLDPSRCEVTYGTQPLWLTPKEFALLELFLRNGRRVFSCSMILEHLWAYEEMPGEDAVRTHIKGLRQKLKGVGLPDVVETVYGIGYRLKPRESTGNAKLSIASQTPNTANPDLRSQDLLSDITEPTQQQTLASVNQIWHRFKARISEQVGVLEQAIAAVWHQQLDEVLRQQARQEAHTLAGSLGTFGLPEGSHLARQIEQLFQGEQPLSQNEAINLREWVVALRQAVEQSHSLSKKESRSVSPEPLHPSTAEADSPLLLIVDRDRSLANQLVTEAINWGFRSEVATNLTEARDKILLEPPDILLLDPAITPTVAESLSLLTELSKQVPPIPVVILTEHNDLTERLEVARLGGRTFLQKATPPSQVLEAVNQVLHQAERAKGRVLVVDDDLALLAIVRSLLEPWGLKITTLAHPQQFWETLEATSPDLLILDIEMPQIGGIELCQIVRNDSRWSGLPIMFLTAHIDADTVNQVFSVGADDFVSKPIVAPELVTRVVNRLERIRFLRNLAETDPLTKLANRQKSTQDLDIFLRLAKRQNQPLCLAVLDLDHFKQVNDRYGHATGDDVLRQIGQLLQGSFRTEDVVARWGGEEFVVGLYGVTQQEGGQRLKKVLETLHQRSFRAVNTTSTAKQASQFQITCSVGVAEYPKNGDSLHPLYQSADSALYQAKASGRGRIAYA
jgi:diguanylate cyclase (GGDEF)-like protein